MALERSRVACTWPGCYAVAVRHGRCEAHVAGMRRGTYYGPQTSNGVRRFRRIRLGFLAANPLCVECAKRNILEPSTVLDHKIPHRGDVDLFWDSNNWQALCKPCHDRKSARESDAGIRGENHAR